MIALLLLPLALWAQEQITLTTYYPAPFGVYNELRTKRLAVGEDTTVGVDDYYNPSHYCWAGACTTTVDANADLLVQGRMGIGTVTPNEALEVAGNIRIDDGGDTYIENPSGAIELHPDDGSHGLILRDYTGDTTEWSGLRHNAAGNRLEFSVEGSGYGSGLVLRSNNRVGIGLNNPSRPLDVSGNTFIRGRLQLGGSDDNWIGDNVAGRTNGMHTNDGALFVPLRNGTASDLRLYITDDSSDSFSIWGNSSGDINDADDIAHFRAEGKVGIGTTNPDARLHIRNRDTALTGGLRITSTYFTVDDSQRGVLYKWLGGIYFDTSQLTLSTESDTLFLIETDPDDETATDKSAILTVQRGPTGFDYAAGDIALTPSAMAIRFYNNIGAVPGGDLHFIANGETRMSLLSSPATVNIGRDDGSTHTLWVWGDIVVSSLEADSGVCCPSSRAKKTAIAPLTAAGYQDILTQLNNTEVVRYRWKDKGLDDELHLGLISEDGPEEIVTADKQNVNFADYLGFLLAALKAQQGQIRELERQISRGSF